MTSEKQQARRVKLNAVVAAAKAQRVPDEDRAGPGRVPVTVSGWYFVPTISGRPAWVRYVWNEGRCEQRECSYDPAAEDAATEADLDLYDLDQAARDAAQRWTPELD